MKVVNLFVIFLFSISSFFLISCGSDSGGGSGDKAGGTSSTSSPLSGGATVFVRPVSNEEVVLGSGLVVEAAQDEILISVKQDITSAELTALIAYIVSLGGEVIGHSSESRILQVRIPKNMDESIFISNVEGYDTVTSAGLNLVAELENMDNAIGYQDYSKQQVAGILSRNSVDEAYEIFAAKASVPSSFVGDWWIENINAGDAWDITTGNSSVKIGIVDSGINLGIVDPSRISVYNILGEEITGSGSDHGSWVTALAAGNGGDATEDTVGVAWDNEIVFIDKWYITSEGIYLTDQVQGLEQAVTKGAKVINFSHGSGPMNVENMGTEEKFLEYRMIWREGITRAVYTARKAGALIVFSAGNDGEAEDCNHHPGTFGYDCDKDGIADVATTTFDGIPNYHAGVTIYDDDQLLLADSSESENSWLTNALIVGATRDTISDKMAPFSRQGSIVNIAAPGEGLGFGLGDLCTGTSCAAPLVTGTGGLVVGLNTDLLGVEVRQILLDSANPTPLVGANIEAGLLDAKKAVELAQTSASAQVNPEINVSLSKDETTSRVFSVTLSDTSVSVMDVFLLVDTSGSYGDDIETYKSVANTFITDLSSLVPDVQFGVGSFADFPISPYGSASTGDEGFVLDQPITSNTSLVTGAIDMLDQPLNYGADFPESQLEALYQAATGAGRDINGDGDYDDLGEISPSSIGWRTGALKVVVLATDATFHNSDVEPGYPGAGFTETLEALTAAGIIVIGIDSGSTGDDLQTVVDATGGLKFNLSSDSSGVAQAIYDGIVGALEHVTLSTQVLGNVEGFVTSITPETHVDVVAGETSEFTVNFNGALNNSTSDLVFNLMIWVKAENSALIKRVPIKITVPKAE